MKCVAYLWQDEGPADPQGRRSTLRRQRSRIGVTITNVLSGLGCERLVHSGAHAHATVCRQYMVPVTHTCLVCVHLLGLLSTKRKCKDDTTRASFIFRLSKVMYARGYTQNNKTPFLLRLPKIYSESPLTRYPNLRHIGFVFASAQC